MFIYTYDLEMIEKLKMSKYPLIKTQTNGDKEVYIFKNINRLVFSTSEKKKFILTNKLFFTGM